MRLSCRFDWAVLIGSAFILTIHRFFWDGSAMTKTGCVVAGAVELVNQNIHRQRPISYTSRRFGMICNIIISSEVVGETNIFSRVPPARARCSFFSASSRFLPLALADAQRKDDEACSWKPACVLNLCIPVILRVISRTCFSWLIAFPTTTRVLLGYKPHDRNSRAYPSRIKDTSRTRHDDIINV